jgi:hypothetical protein
LTATVCSKYLDESPTKTSAISSALNDEDVDDAHAWLTAQGYSFMDTNSVVLVKRYTNAEPESAADIDAESQTARKPFLGNDPVRVFEDTILWAAFENPTSDPANHTAVVTRWTNAGVKSSVFLEMDVSTDTATVMRSGSFVGGEFIPHPEPVDLAGFWKCLGQGTGSALLGCALTNCFYFKCVGAGAVASAIICGIDAIFGGSSES